MNDKEIFCTECETEYTITHEEVDDPEYCSFCGCKLNEEEQEDDWFDEEGFDDE